MGHHTWPFFVFLVETWFLHVGQAGFEHPTAGDPPASASQSAGIIGVNHLDGPTTVLCIDLIPYNSAELIY